MLFTNKQTDGRTNANDYIMPNAKALSIYTMFPRLNEAGTKIRNSY